MSAGELLKQIVACGAKASIGLSSFFEQEQPGWGKRCGVDHDAVERRPSFGISGVRMQAQPAGSRPLDGMVGRRSIAQQDSSKVL